MIKETRKIPQCGRLVKAFGINPILPGILDYLIPGRARVCRGSSS